MLPECEEYFDKVKLFNTANDEILIATGGNGAKLQPIKGQEHRFTKFLKKTEE